jgi:hypothetical protein
MIPKECKHLAEVDFPIAVVSKHAAREKSIRHGHPSTLHLWWAQRPLAAGVRGRLSECIQGDETGKPRLTVTLPDGAALDKLASSLARLLAVGDGSKS